MVQVYQGCCKMLPNSLKMLIDSFQSLPGIGNKTAERLAFSMLDFNNDDLTSFSDAILAIRDNIRYCELCGNISDDVLCNVCVDKSRDFSTIFVVEKPKDIILFEKLGIFKGVYHVLNGLISPLDGIGPDDISLDKLMSRLNDGNVNEVILALKPTVEGETTMQYIKKILESKDIKVSKIATGIPIGTDMEYIDSLTLELAIDERKNMN